MIPPLNEILGLSSAAPQVEIGHASEIRFQAAFERAARGDADAQRELLALRIAYLNWAYANPQVRPGAGKSLELPAMPQRWS